MKRGVSRKSAAQDRAEAAKRVNSDLDGLRQRIRRLVSSKAYGMVNATITEVNNKGNVPALKFLFELIGLYPGNGEEMDEPQDVLARTLIRRLGLSEPEAAPVTNDCAPATAGESASSDAVE